MTDPDLIYVGRLLQAKVIAGPVLELGTGWSGATSRDLVKNAGLEYFGTDMEAGNGVDFVANFEKPQEMTVFRFIAPVGCVFILNVLEHTFDPIRVLDNALTLLKPGGHLVLLTPAVWPLHNYPMDAWRIMPNFYEQYAKRRGLHLLEEWFEYIGIGPIHAFRNPDQTFSFPPPTKPGTPGWRYWVDRAIHKACNTFGRSMFQPSHVAVGAVLAVPDAGG